MRTNRLVTGLLAATLLAACTGSEPTEDETEVQGLILEREDPVASGDDEPDDRPDSVEDQDAGDDGDEPEQEAGDSAAGSDQAEPSPSGPSGSGTSGGSDGSASGPTSTSGGGSSSPAPRSGSPSEPTPDPEPSPQPDPPSQPDPEPEPDPQPEPEPEPTPVRLEDGFERGGMAWSVQDGEWVDTSSRVHAPDRPLVEAGLVPPADASATAAERDARCAVVLHAPQNRGLHALGEMEVVLVAEDREGERTSLLRYVLDLDVELAAGDQSTMPVPDRFRTVARDEVTNVSCEVRYTAR